MPFAPHLLGTSHCCLTDSPRTSYSSFQTYQIAGFLSDLHMAYAGSSIQGAEQPKLVHWECSHGHKENSENDADA